ncbi:MAG TPA: DUF2147 domain-containing protein [Methylovirgula sp.]|jgi:uncharacterized protein (DUF2147 family)|nr:DUF2147 domain-containing protein [Methylovirgula sp.]
MKIHSAKVHSALALISGASAFVIISSSVALASQAPVGHWRVASGKAIIDIRPCGENLCGFVASGGDAVGKQIFFNMKQEGDEWSGTIVDVSDGQRYSGHISLVSDSTLKVEGCALGGLFCGDQKWSRVD